VVLSALIGVHRRLKILPALYDGQDTAIFTKALVGSGIDVRLGDWYGK
jgi:hypothetical protein